MKYLGFDVGTKRIGVAHSDNIGRFAFPESVISNDANLYNIIFQLCEKHKPDVFVVGYADSGTSNANPVQKHINRFCRELQERFGLPVYSMNESGTSGAVRAMNNMMAGQKHTQATKRSIAENDSVDAHAAALILQRYLDFQGASV